MHKLTPVFNEAVQNGKLHQSARRGIISLLEKVGRNPLYLKNWRPLSLLNTDYKIFAKILATRIDIVLPKLIHHMQTGFTKGRNISENIIKFTNTIDCCNAHKIKAVLISFDFEKAFDPVEWDAIDKILQICNFGHFFVEQLQRYTKILSVV